jgi:hypothetical protein
MLLLIRGADVTLATSSRSIPARDQFHVTINSSTGTAADSQLYGTRVIEPYGDGYKVNNQKRDPQISKNKTNKTTNGAKALLQRRFYTA